MFFIGIIGIGSKKKDLGRISFKCTGCVGESFSLIELSRSFDLFFIPLFKFNKEYIIVCERCRSVYKLKNSSISKVIKNRVAEYEEVEKIIMETNTCPYCGTNILGGFSFCPKCGKSLKK